MKKQILIPFILIAVLIAGFLGFQTLVAAPNYTQPLYGSYENVPTADTTDNVTQRDVVGNKTDAAAAGAVSETESLMGYLKQLVSDAIASTASLVTIDGYFDVPAKDATTDTIMRDVIGKKDDTEVAAPTTDKSLMAYLKGVLTDTNNTIPASIVVLDAMHDVPTVNGTDDAIMRDVIGRKTDAAVGTPATTNSEMAYIKGILTDTETTIPGTITTLQLGVGAIDVSANGITLYVDSALGSDAYDGLTWATAKATIGAAVALAEDYSTIYVGGVSYTEAVTTPVGIERVRLIGVCANNQIPYWQSGAADAIQLAIVSGEWEVAGFRFASTSATVANVTINRTGSSSIIRDCWFSGSGSESGIEGVGPTGPPTDLKILNNRFSGFTTGGALEGAVCATDYSESGAVVWEIIGNMFGDNTHNINLDALSCRIEGNTFTKSTSASAMTILISTRGAAGVAGAGGGNAVVGNYFYDRSDQVTVANGYLSSTDDTWAGNFCIDGKMNDGLPHEPRSFIVTADLGNATWQTAAAHEIAVVTGAVRMQIWANVTETVVTTSNDGTMALGFAGNVASIFAATALDSAGTTFTDGDIVSAVYGAAATTPVAGAEAQSALTHAMFDVISTQGVDVGYTIATHAATDGTVIFHVTWEPLDATGLVTAGAGGAF